MASKDFYERLRELEKQMGGATPAFNAGVVARGERQGAADPAFSSFTPEELAMADRYFQVKSTGERLGPGMAVGDAVANIGYDALKSSGALPVVAGAMGKVPGLENLAALGTPDQTTSAPNFGPNVIAALRGAVDSTQLMQILKALQGR